MPMTTRGVKTNPQDSNGQPLPENLAAHPEMCDCAPCGPVPARSMDVSDPDFTRVITQRAPDGGDKFGGDDDTSDDGEVEEATLAPGSGIVAPFGDSIL